jgi:hypothetical protein
MSFFPDRERQVIEAVCSVSDVTTRDEMNQGHLVDENDYTSTLMTKVRTLVNQRLSSVRAHAQRLPSKEETRFGADACILLVDSDSDLLKVCLYEAKWPRAESREPRLLPMG